MNNKIREMKLRIIEEIINIKEDNIGPFAERYLNALYEIIVKDDYDYIEDLFYNEQDFKEFIEKYKGEENE